MAELLFLFTRKFSPREIPGEKTFKKEIFLYVKQLLMNLALICARKLTFVTSIDLKVSIRGSTELKFCQISPFTPTIYELYIQFINKTGKHAQE